MMVGRRTGVQMKQNVKQNAQGFDDIDDFWGDDDVETEEVKAFDVIFNGIKLLDADRQRQALTTSELGQLDAIDCDLIIQLGVFGKEVYC